MSTVLIERGALEPQRRPGRLRVAALLEAGADVIAERGYEAATMAEVAARAGAPIGSLYRFFPNKEVLADALIQRFADLIDESFAAIDAEAATLSVGALTDALFGLIGKMHREKRTIVALLDAHSDWSARRAEFKSRLGRRIAQTLKLSRSKLDDERVRDIAIVLMHMMKTMAHLKREAADGADSGAMTELREMTRLYLADRLGDEPAKRRR
ncbi:TetR/AcrR family transcriptional regulator [Methylocapsa sp. S129]|uniref:TetR/AcrR family transcriptional regulator n=1 Tax=Methylocapsa sp. S129 TaxID=1641869 RepID=UPI00131B70A6|nr:TetR/AcrR family transcriptional regulator [Methylocapsa sp. S129]